MADESVSQYLAFLDKKMQGGADSGFDPVWMPEFLFDFQKEMVEWAVRKGRAAIFADCGLGKTPMGLVWASNVARKTNKPVLYLTPLAVAPQTVRRWERDSARVSHRVPGAATVRLIETLLSAKGD